MKRRVKPGFWKNYDNVMNESLKYCSKYEFEKGSSGAYDSALRNGWLNDFTWLKDPRIKPYDNNLHNHFIYVFKDDENMFCYVGLSFREKRKNEHNYKKNGKYDALKQHFLNIDRELPEWIILESGLTKSEAKIREAYWMDYYVSIGYSLINIAKAGSLGLCSDKITEELCYKNARECEYLNEFMIRFKSCYNKANANGWIDDYTWLKRRSRKQKNNRNSLGVIMYKNNVFVSEFPSLNEASRATGIPSSKISKICNGKMITNDEYNFKFSGSRWIIDMLDSYGNIINTFNTANDASQKTGISVNSIRHCLDRSCEYTNGYKFKYRYFDTNLVK